MPKRILFINAPAGAGKDTVAKMLLDQAPHHVKILKFATPLKEAAHTLCGLQPDADQFEAVKDTPHPLMPFSPEKMRRLSPREMYIHVSEICVKPYFGKDFFGQAMLQKIRTTTRADDIAVFPDSGFTDEVEPIRREFGDKKCVRVHLSRPGKTFEGDSRNYWSIPSITTLFLKNDGDLANLGELVKYLVLPLCFKP